jgi:hypothetical protein
MVSVNETLRGKYPAKEHARRVAEWIVQNGGKKDGFIYLEAQKLKYNEVCNATDAMNLDLSNLKVKYLVRGSCDEAYVPVLTSLVGQ